MAFLDRKSASLVCFGFKHEVVETTGEPMGLEIKRVNPGQGSEQLTSFLRTVKLIETVDESLIGGTKLILIESSLEMLVVSKYDLSLLFAKRAPLLGSKSRFSIKVESADLLLGFCLLRGQTSDDDVLEYC